MYDDKQAKSDLYGKMMKFARGEMAKGVKQKYAPPPEEKPAEPDEQKEEGYSDEDLEKLRSLVE